MNAAIFSPWARKMTPGQVRAALRSAQQKQAIDKYNREVNRYAAIKKTVNETTTARSRHV